MTDMQFTLFFVALLVGYALVHLRMIRFEEHLQKLSGIRELDERLKGLDERVEKLAKSFDGVRFERVSAQLERLHEDLEDLREATGQVRHAVVQIPQMAPAAGGERGGDGAAPTNVETPKSRIVATIETRLLQLGYRNLRLLGDLSGAEPTDEIEITVEAERNGMPCKGRVRMRNGSVQDVNVQTVAQSFP